VSKPQAGKSAADRASKGSGAANVDPTLSAILRVEYEALQNDLRQAKEMAADFQRQLAWKSNDFAQLKQIFEKTQGDLSRLQAAIVALREERHRLAADAMRATALDRKLAAVTAEQNELRSQIESFRKDIPTAAPEATRRIRERENQIADLTLQVMNLKEALAQAHRRASNLRWIG
jgi:chromosome segregation ATPase